MALEADIATLASAPLFSLLDKDALRLLAFAAEARALRAGEVLFRKGDRSDGGYVVTRGIVVLDASGRGEEPPSFIAAQGALIGQTALFARGIRPATATAREPSAVLRVSPTLMRRVLEEFPATAGAMRDVLALEASALSEGLEQVRLRLLAIDGHAP